MKRLLIIGASDFQLPAILKAKKMGLYVGVVDYNPNAIGIAYADKYYNVSTIDLEGVYEAAKKFRADGIITLCTDMPMRALAYTCEKLGLIGPDMSTAITATDKGKMIQAFEKNNVRHPKYLVVNKLSDYHDGMKDMVFPVITKPTDNSGSRGIMFASNEEELKEALTYSSNNGREGSVIVEEYMRGPEVSVEVMVIDGKAYVLQVTDKLTTGKPHFVEIGHSQPSRLAPEIIQEIKKLAAKATIAVGIKNGPAHAEIIVDKDGPKMVEIGARMGGGCITTHLVPLSTGIDMTKAVIDIVMGNTVDIMPKMSMGSAIRFIIPKKGILKSISGVEEAKSIPGIQLVEIQCKIGQILHELENGTCRIGYVIAQAENADKAIEICEQALSVISIETEELKNEDV